MVDLTYTPIDLTSRTSLGEWRAFAHIPNTWAIRLDTGFDRQEDGGHYVSLAALPEGGQLNVTLDFDLGGWRHTLHSGNLDYSDSQVVMRTFGLDTNNLPLEIASGTRAHDPVFPYLDARDERSNNAFDVLLFEARKNLILSHALLIPHLENLTRDEISFLEQETGVGQPFVELDNGKWAIAQEFNSRGEIADEWSCVRTVDALAQYRTRRDRGEIRPCSAPAKSRFISDQEVAAFEASQRLQSVISSLSQPSARAITQATHQPTRAGFSSQTVAQRSVPRSL